MRAQRSPWLVVAVVLTGAFAVGINFTILAVSRPVIAKDLGVDAATFVWLISGPILANALVTTAAGRLGDLHGHRRLYLWGMVASAVFAALSVVAWDGPSLVAFRVLGAIAGAAAGPSSMAIINLSVEPAKRSRALGYWSLVGAGAPVVGLIAQPLTGLAVSIVCAAGLLVGSLVQLGDLARATNLPRAALRGASPGGGEMLFLLTAFTLAVTGALALVPASRPPPPPTNPYLTPTCHVWGHC